MGNHPLEKMPVEHIDNPETLNIIENGLHHEAEPELQQQITVLIVGAGMRGQIYASYAKDFPHRMKVIGVAEPIQHRREMMKKRYEIDDEHVFKDWKDVSSFSFSPRLRVCFPSPQLVLTKLLHSQLILNRFKNRIQHYEIQILPTSDL